ncbi:MAG: hypothetical protein K2K45_05150 [Muribaculaceae bacterium]|nr:hypothetical protein [Muribaculaceae bacterium]
MELKKTSENWSRTFDESGNETNTLENAQFNVLDDNGAVIGNANVGNGYANVNIHNIGSFNGVTEGVVKLNEILGITE